MLISPALASQLPLVPRVRKKELLISWIPKVCAILQLVLAL